MDKILKFNKMRILQGILYIVCFIVAFKSMDIIVGVNGLTYLDSGDAVNQGYPVLGYIQRCIRERSSLIKFDFSIGLGEDSLLVMSCHGLLNPIHWIMAFLFKDVPTYLLYKYVIIVKFFLGGLAFLTYSNYKKKNRFLAVAASIIYAFSMWGIVFAVAFLGFYDLLIALPLLILGIDKLYDDEKRIPFEIIVSIIYLGSQGFYYVFMHCVIGTGYFFIKLIWNRKKNIYNYIFRYGVSCMMSLMLITPIFLPNIYWFLISSRNSPEQCAIAELVPSLYELKTFLRSFLTPTINTNSHYFISNIALFALVLFGLQFKKYKEESTILLISVLALITPGIGLLLNGFGYISDRGYYFVWFVLAYCILCGFEEMLIITPKSFFLSAGIVISYNLFIIYREAEFAKYHITSLICLILLLVLGIILQLFDRKKILIVGIVISSACLSAYNIYFLWDMSNENTAEYAKLRYAEKFLTTDILKEDEGRDYHQYLCEDNDWFRVQSDEFLITNESLLKGFYSTEEYFSIVNPWKMRFGKEISGGLTVKSLLGVKLYEQRGKNYYNSNALPIVIGYDDYITEEQIQNWNPYERQSIVLQNIILENTEETKLSSYNSNLTLIDSDIEQVGLHNFSEGGYNATVNSRISIKIQSPLNMVGEYYVQMTNVYLENTHDTGEINPIIQIDDSDIYKTSNSDVWACVVPTNDGEIDISFLQDANIKYDSINVYYYSVDDLEKDVQQRRDLLNSSTKLLHNMVVSDIDMKKNGYLLYTIPYSKGWKAYVDGELTPIQVADYGLMGIKIQEGKHTIQLVYRTPFKNVSWLIFMIGLGGLIVWIGVYNHYLKNNKK